MKSTFNRVALAVIVACFATLYGFRHRVGQAPTASRMPTRTDAEAGPPAAPIFFGFTLNGKPCGFLDHSPVLEREALTELGYDQFSAWFNLRAWQVALLLTTPFAVTAALVLRFLARRLRRPIAAVPLHAGDG